MNDPVATLLLQWGIPLLVVIVIGEIAIVASEIKRIRYHNKTFVRKYKDEIDKVNRFE